MSAELITQTLLAAAASVTGIVGARVYPEALPDMQPLPAVVHSLVIGVSIGSIGADQYVGCQRSRMQLDAFAPDFETAKNLVNLAKLALRFQRGLVAGVRLVAILPDSEGPNAYDPDRRLIVCSAQVLVIWRET